MLFNDQIKEADKLISGMLDLLLRSVNAPTGRQAAALRSSIGYLRVSVEKSLKRHTIGTDMSACFDAAIAAGATAEGVGYVRRYLVEAKMVGDIGIMVQSYAILMAVSAISQTVVDQGFKNREAVRESIFRLQRLFQQAKDMVADDMSIAVFNALNKLSSSVMRHMSRTELQLPRIVKYNTQTSLPALTLANMIFRNGSRYNEIITENNVVHPAFCPRELRVLST